MDKINVDAAAVMRPKLVRIGNTCYRRLDVPPDGVIDDFTQKLGIHTQTFQSTSKFPPKNTNLSSPSKYNIDALEADDFVPQSIGDELEDDIEQIVLNEGEELKTDDKGKCTLRIHVCSAFFGFIIGKGGQTRKRIENETRTFLRIPPSNNTQSEEDNFIQILGSSQRDVLIARQRISSLVESSRKRQLMSHFVSIPLALDEDSQIRKRYDEFKQEILADVKCSLSKGIEEKHFKTGIKLHLTLRALYLGDSYERKQTVKLLDSFKTQLGTLLNGQRIQLHMKGLDIMNDDPSEVSVLYAKVTQVGDSDLFRQIVNAAYDHFAPYAKDAYGDGRTDWKVKIHATVLNTREKEERPENGNNNQNNGRRPYAKRTVVDVRNILEKYGDYDFGIVTFDQLHVCTMMETDGYYVTLAKINLYD